MTKEDSLQQSRNY